MSQMIHMVTVPLTKVTSGPAKRFWLLTANYGKLYPTRLTCD